ncbi:hypothetical protein B0I03_101493 [Flavobacterium aquaticum]|uniref:Uncharacterized protein n=1 Tax=Flavobacterium aquaticum TaxID=1236486 RepID=A0A327Z4K6_9FLAO|nr:hypothetical protein [Flavobacterium aquaticum]RAK25319.1 hypothetical protein B0I03_101493 [Flavobacterium aquaticum]
MDIKKIYLILLIGLFSCNKEEKKSINMIETKKTEVLEFEIVKPAELEKNVDDFFSNVSKIEIFAYLDRNKWDKSDNPDYRNPDYIKNNKIEIKDKYLRNRIVLSTSQVKELQAGFKNGYYDIAAACYDPRHAIIFYDKNDVIIGNIEICFECNNVSSSKNLYSIGRSASNQMDLFKKFGITYFEDTKEEYDTFLNNLD